MGKCRCFGIKKNGKQSTQFRLNFKVNNEIIPALKLNNSFAYLGKNSVTICHVCHVIRNKILQRNLVTIWRKLTFFPYIWNKTNILTKFVYSKLRWDLTIYHFPETWILQNLDNKANWYIHKWLSILISGYLLCLKVKQLGIGLNLPSEIYRLNKITEQNISKSPKN